MQSKGAAPASSHTPDRLAEGNAFDRLDPAYQDALRRSIDLCIDHAFADVAALLQDGRWDDLLFLNEALPNRPVYVERYTPLLAKEFLVCLITVAAQLTSRADIRLASVAEELALYALTTRTPFFAACRLLYASDCATISLFPVARKRQCTSPSCPMKYSN